MFVIHESVTGPAWLEIARACVIPCLDKCISSYSLVPVVLLDHDVMATWNQLNAAMAAPESHIHGKRQAERLCHACGAVVLQQQNCAIRDQQDTARFQPQKLSHTVLQPRVKGIPEHIAHGFGCVHIMSLHLRCVHIMSLHRLLQTITDVTT